MTNIIFGNMAAGIITIIIGNISFANIHNAKILFIIRAIMAVLTTAISYILGRYNYSVKIWKVVLLGAINIIICFTSLLIGWEILAAITMGPWGVYISITSYFATKLVVALTVLIGIWIPYALICLGIIAGRRKNREQYEAFLAIEKEEKERKKAYRGEERKEDDGVI